MTLQSGRPLTVTYGRNESNTDGGADRPNVIGNWRVASPTPGHWFNPRTLTASAKRRLPPNRTSAPNGKSTSR